MSCDSGLVRIINADVIEGLRSLDAGSVHCCVTSPPYFGLRDYGVAGQIGNEATPEMYVSRLVEVFREVRRVLRDDGTLWLNLGDSYSSHGAGAAGKELEYQGDTAHRRSARRHGEAKQLLGIPWRVALALQSDGWVLRADIIWHKPNPMPESVRDRPTKSHEYLFLLAKRPRYFYDAEAVKEASISQPRVRERPDGEGVAESKRRGHGSCAGVDGTRNLRSVWTVATQPYKGAHFACFPPKLIEPCVKAGTSERGCCAGCGAPWRRVVERSRVATRPGENTKLADAKAKLPSEEPGRDRGAARFEKTTLGSIVGNRDPQRHVTATRTTGWTATCGCNAGVTPCTVLDPFSGAATTGLVARRLGRRYVGVEINPAYVQLSHQRLEQETLRHGSEATA